MDVLPSIDIKDGRCVRLFQGDFGRLTVHDDDPVAVARRWRDSGASLIHVVDLDGARDGVQANRAIVERIVNAVDVPVQVGGGIRTIERAAELLGAGVARVVFGTAAVRQRAVVTEAATRWPEATVVSIDARDGKAATDGWEKPSLLDALELGAELAKLGVQWIIYTDISRDGTLTEPNFDAMRRMVEAVGRDARVIASGGIARLDHVRQMSQTGVAAVIVGKALYTGMLDLKEALALTRGGAC